MGVATIDPHNQKEHTKIHKIPKFGVNRVSFDWDTGILLQQLSDQTSRTRVQNWTESNSVLFGKQLVFTGNDDAETVVTHWFAADRKVTARFVRVVCLSCRPDLICCLRFELFGCDGGL